jgi:hypothetical protein
MEKMMAKPLHGLARHKGKKGAKGSSRKVVPANICLRAFFSLRLAGP